MRRVGKKRLRQQVASTRTDSRKIARPLWRQEDDRPDSQFLEQVTKLVFHDVGQRTDDQQ